MRCVIPDDTLGLSQCRVVSCACRLTRRFRHFKKTEAKLLFYFNDFNYIDSLITFSSLLSLFFTKETSVPKSEHE